MSNQLSKLEELIGHVFDDKNLLRQALVHRSYLNEHTEFDLGHNERLEFLGDAVLELVVTEYLYKHYPRAAEGELTNWRASLVNTKSLAQVAQELSLNDYILLSRGEAKDSESKARQIILANAVEAIIGALYLDHSIGKAKKFIKRYFINRLDYILKNQLHIDPKSNLQERIQEEQGVTPTYKVISESGPDHNKKFVIGVYVGAKLLSRGEGSSKQAAQEEAAKRALENNF